MHYIGLLSGTSMDAVDGALIDFSDDLPVLVDYQQYPLDQKIRKELISLNKISSIEIITRLDIALGNIFAEAALEIIKRNKIQKSKIVAVGSHGQTILHRPEPPHPTTLQIGDPNIIAHLTGISTVADFRRMDMAAGGQGAPLAPVFHQHMFRHKTEYRVVLNIGGMGNLTVLPAIESKKPVTGYDTGPGNVLLDIWINQNKNRNMDQDGAWAASGNIHEKLLTHFLEDSYFSRGAPKSTGRDYFNKDWLATRLESFRHTVTAQDIQATLAELTATTIANEIKKNAPDTTALLVCGGGVHNQYLLKLLTKNLPGIEVVSTGNFGVNPDAVEAMTFALLAKYRLDKVPGNIPSVTGANREVILGAVYQP